MTDHPAPAAPTEPLRFETDRGASRSIWIAVALVVALIGWMGSGIILPRKPPPRIRRRLRSWSPALLPNP